VSKAAEQEGMLAWIEQGIFKQFRGKSVASSRVLAKELSGPIVPEYGLIPVALPNSKGVRPDRGGGCIAFKVTDCHRQQGRQVPGEHGEKLKAVMEKVSGKRGSSVESLRKGFEIQQGLKARTRKKQPVNGEWFFGAGTTFFQLCVSSETWSHFTYLKSATLLNPFYSYLCSTNKIG